MKPDPMRTKHTPGPHAYTPTRGELYREDHDVQPLIATINFDGVSEEQAHADGYLYAAAPEMFDALREVRDWFAEAPIAEIEAVEAAIQRDAPTRAVLAAIAKAEGRANG